MVTDPIGDLLVRLKNGAQRRFETVTVPNLKIEACHFGDFEEGRLC